MARQYTVARCFDTYRLPTHRVNKLHVRKSPTEAVVTARQLARLNLARPAPVAASLFTILTRTRRVAALKSTPSEHPLIFLLTHTVYPTCTYTTGEIRAATFILAHEHEMGDRIAQLERLLEAERQARDQADKALEEERQARKAAEKAREEADRIAALALPQNVTDFLEGCHSLYRQVKPVMDNSSATTGNTTDPVHRLFPPCITPWTDFQQLQRDEWDRLEGQKMTTSF